MNATGAIDVYFEKEIEIVVSNPDTFPVESAKRALTEAGVEFTRLAPAPR